MLRVLTILMLLLWPGGSLAAAASDASGVIVQRTREAVEVLQGRREASAIFDQRFLAELPADRVRAMVKQWEAGNGQLLAAEDIRPEGSGSATFRLRFERATANGRVTLEPSPPFKVSGLWITSFVPLHDTPEALLADFAALPGRSGFVVAKLGDGAPSTLLAHHAGEQFAIGSTFKLWVLDALAEDVAAGRRRWDEVVRLGPRSLPAGVTQDWPPQAPVTVETLATLMISISDNTATDMLIRLIGRERIAERVRATGHADPSRMLPVLTTAEAFALKLGPAERRAAYAAADDAGQRRLLGDIDAAKELAPPPPPAGGAPVAIDSIEWFAAPGDIVRVLDALRRRDDPRVLAILGVTDHLDDAQRRRFAYAGYKGGSETGVLNLTWLLRDKAGAWFAVTASWNDPARALDTGTLDALAARLIARTGGEARP